MSYLPIPIVLFLHTMSLSVETLSAYLEDQEDGTGVVNYIREKWPKSLTTYVSNVKKTWMTLNKHHPDFETSFAKALAQAQATEPPTAVQYMHKFHAMPLSDKNKLQRSLRTNQYSGSVTVDRLIAGLKIFPDYIDDLRLTHEEMSHAKQRLQKSLNEKSANSWQLDSSAILRRAESTLADERANAFDLACALAVVTGRRMVELFRTGEFKPRPKTHGEYTALFSGQVKKNDLVESLPYAIPLLCKYKDVKSAIARLRKEKPAVAMTNMEVNQKWSNSCNTAARRWLGSGRKFHDLRMAYAVISYTLALPHTWSLNLFVSKVLGHAALGNSLHYTTIQITNVQESDKRPWREALTNAAL